MDAEVTRDRTHVRATTEDDRATTLVWIDTREAVIVRIEGDAARIERVRSDVPAHHRATGHVRHAPGVRHGGGGAHSAGEAHRIEHLNTFVGDVADRLAADEDLLVLGPGVVREHLVRHVSAGDRHHGRHRVIDCAASPRLTDRQLISRLRRLSGGEPRKHSVGAYRWSDPPGHHASGQVDLVPRRLADKPSSARRDARARTEA